MPPRGSKLLSLQDRLSAWANQVREQASRLPPGPERDALLKKLSQADTALNLEDWLKPPGLRSPR
jgi:hypothetical protein